jgi:hypothetical protein
VVVPGEIPLNHDAFRFLAEQAGLDIGSPHLDELYSYLHGVLSSVRSLCEIEVAGAEPDLAFIPSPGED